MSPPSLAVVRRPAAGLAALAIGTALAIAGAGCSSSASSVDLSGKEFTDRTGRKAVTIEAVDNSFEPQYVTISPGTKVTFVNDGRNRHNVLPVDGGFRTIDTDRFESGDSAVRRFAESGDVPYFCSLHGTPTSGMNGAIRVVE